MVIHAARQARRVFCSGALLSSFLTLAAVRAAEVEPPAPEAPQVSPASDAAKKAIAGFQVPTGMTAELVAAEAALANGVCFCFDRRGRIYVAETYRQEHGVEDNRGHMTWVDDDLAARTVEDRLAFFRKHLGERIDEYTKCDDRIRLLTDTDGDGRYEKSTVFADRFNGILDGTGAGLLAHQGDVFYTCIPNLWRLQDTKGAGVADRRTALSTGYGVHVAYRGHDMHGLCLGPDGKLYFSIGDRGFNVLLPDGRRLAFPDRGAVLRCQPDGSELEVVHEGLRNPQELAFDDEGNLFTADNNCDSIDLARWVYIVEGGDSGWRMNYQYLADRGPWNREKLWELPWDGQPAYVLPPLSHISEGPAGLAYDPGVGLPDKYRRHFFLADFRGAAAGSGIHSFALEPQGAAFKIVDREQFFWGVLATDCDFAPDGSFHVLDWVESWEGRGKGRIYRLSNSLAANERGASDSGQLLAANLQAQPLAELIDLLAHADRRVRLAAQFAMVDHGAAAIPSLVQSAAKSEHQPARLHAIWALGMIGRRSPEALTAIQELLTDDTAEVRAQAAKVLGDVRATTAADALIGRLVDDSPRVRLLAALALARLGQRKAVEPALAMLRDNADRDAYLRHGGVMILSTSADVATLLALADDPSSSVRLGALLALRRLRAPQIAKFLNDSSSRLVEEAALAIHDVPIDAAEPELAAILSRPSLSEPALWRALNASFRMGGAKQAAAIVGIAARTDAPLRLRIEALHMLSNWQKPGGRDRVTGAWRPLAPREAEIAETAVQPAITGLLSAPAEIQRLAIQLAGQLDIRTAVAGLAEIVADEKCPATNRAAALQALGHLHFDGLTAVVERAANDAEPTVRAAALQMAARLPAERAMKLLSKALAGDSLGEQQAAMAALAQMKTSAADEQLSNWCDRLIASQVPLGLQLDLIMAATERGTPELRTKLHKYSAKWRPDFLLAQYRECLEGGDAERGRRIALDRVDLSCNRCHKFDEYGGLVGPDLSKIGGKQTRWYLLEAIVQPNRSIAKGFESVLITTEEGQVISGVLRSEDADSLQLIKADGTPVTIAKSNIESRTASASAMPADLAGKLSKSELRDLIEFLSSLK